PIAEAQVAADRPGRREAVGGARGDPHGVAFGADGHAAGTDERPIAELARGGEVIAQDDQPSGDPKPRLEAGIDQRVVARDAFDAEVAALVIAFDAGRIVAGRVGGRDEAEGDARPEGERWARTKQLP